MSGNLPTALLGLRELHILIGRPIVDSSWYHFSDYQFQAQKIYNLGLNSFRPNTSYAAASVQMRKLKGNSSATPNSITATVSSMYFKLRDKQLDL